MKKVLAEASRRLLLVKTYRKGKKALFELEERRLWLCSVVTFSKTVTSNAGKSRGVPNEFNATFNTS